MEKIEINKYQTDALQELGNIGAAHAATTLSQMLMSSIEMSVPEIEIVDISDIGNYVGDEICALVVFQIHGDFESEGYIVVVFPKESILRLTNRMLGSADEERDLNEMDESAIIEVGNIMVSAFLDAVAELLNIILLPSPPAMQIDMALAGMQSLIATIAIDVDDIVLFKTELKSDEPPLFSDIFLLPDARMLKQMIKLLDEAVKGV